MVLVRLAWVPLVLAAVMLGACGDDDDGERPTPTADDTPTAGPDETVSATPGVRVVEPSSVLFEARLDAAGRLAIDPTDVRLVSLRHAGFNGCLGFYPPGDVACAELFVGGFIAEFSDGTERYRYHFGGNLFVAVSFEDGTFDDGSPVPAEIRADFHRILANYARHDVALRLGIDTNSVATAAIVPVMFPNTCLGFERDGEACAEAEAAGAIVLFVAPGRELVYHVSEGGAVVATDFEDGQRRVFAEPAIVAVQQAMREDVAARAEQPLEAVSVVAFREGTWSDGCLGVHRGSEACTQALVPGWLALLTEPSGVEHRYHGTEGRFIAASFEEGARLSDMLPGEE